MPDYGGDYNHLWSALWRWTNTSALPNGAFETDEREQAYCNWLKQQVVNHFTTSDFRIGADNVGHSPLHTSRCIVGRALPLHTTETIRHLFKYTCRISTDMKWVIVERPEPLRIATTYDPLPFLKLSKVIPCNSLPDMVMKWFPRDSDKRTTPAAFRFHFN